MTVKLFGIVSLPIMKDTEITLEAKGLYALLTCYCNKERTCFPSTSTLAKLSNRSCATVFRLLTELEKAGVIRKIRQGRRRIIMVKD